MRQWAGIWVVGAFCAALATVLYLQNPPVHPWPSYADVFDDVAPSVVNVRLDEDPPRLGTGFAVGPTEVITARHLVVGATSAQVTDLGGTLWTATVVGTDARSDLALLRVDGAALRPARVGDTEELRVGDTVVAVGNPYGLGHSLAVGVVGQLGRRLDAAGPGPRVEFLQLSLPLNLGNSGGPLVDSTGAVVGVLTGTHAQGQAIAFAVPAEQVVAALPGLRQGAHVSRGFLGLTTETLDGQQAVASVLPSGPADIAGIRRGDLLSAFDGEALDSADALQRILDRLPGGHRTTVRLLRDGQLMVLDVQLADWAEQAVVVGGMTLRPDPGSGGRVVALRPRSRAEAAGVQVGDRLKAVDGAPVHAPADARDLLSAGGATRLDLLREGRIVQIELAPIRPPR